MTKGGSIILRIYFALVAFVTLMILIFSTADMINLGLKTYIFTRADAPAYSMPCPERIPAIEGEKFFEKIDCDEMLVKEKAANAVRKQQDLVRDLSMILVSLPLFLIHFRIVYRDWKDEKNSKT